MVTSTVASIFGASVFIFILLLLVVNGERRRGRRFFAGRVRTWFDGKADRFDSWIVRSWEHFIKYMVQLNWYYSIHSVLRTVLRGTVAFYTFFENMFERNRKRTKQLRAEKKQLGKDNHLQQMAEHKEGTALTAAQKRKLKKRELEGKN